MLHRMIIHATHCGGDDGPRLRTAAGLKRSRRANWKHGARSRAVRELQAKNRRCLRELNLVGKIQRPSRKPSDLNDLARGFGTTKG
jgi:hypothetical protein